MAGNIMIGHNMKGAVILRHENERVNFFGFVKSNVRITKELTKIAENFLNLLLECWTENYDQLCKLQDETEFRYQSFKWLKLYAMSLVRDGKINPQEVKMTITAVCYLQGKEKSFWINTGDDNVYAYDGGSRLYRCSRKVKYLKSHPNQSIFTIDTDYAKNIEGHFIEKPECFFIVTSTCTRYFEQCIQSGNGVSRENLKAFACAQNKPTIIGELFCY